MFAMLWIALATANIVDDNLPAVWAVWLVVSVGVLFHALVAILRARRARA